MRVGVLNVDHYVVVDRDHQGVFYRSDLGHPLTTSRSRDMKSRRDGREEKRMKLGRSEGENGGRKREKKTKELLAPPSPQHREREGRQIVRNSARELE